MEHNKKGTATNRDGMGSTYAGTQTPNPKDPDGYQQPKKTEADDADKASPNKKHPDKEDLGSEYHEPDSYGEKKPLEETKEDNEGTAEGTPIR